MVGKVTAIVVKMYKDNITKEVRFLSWTELENFIAQQDQLPEKQWGLEFFTEILTDQGRMELAEGAGPKTIIGQQMFALSCAECDARIWSHTRCKYAKIFCANCS